MDDFRDMVPDDYAAVRALWDRAEGIGLSGADSERGFWSFLERNPGLSLVAVSRRSGGAGGPDPPVASVAPRGPVAPITSIAPVAPVAPVASVIAAVLCGHDGRRGYIHHLAVDPAFRRRGLARRLVRECLSRLAERGIQKGHAFVFSTNAPALSFWRSTGWTQRLELAMVSCPTRPSTGDLR